MRKDKTLEGTYSGCSAEGSFTPIAQQDLDQVKAMVSVALTDLETLKEWEKKAPKESGQWNAILKLAYDVVHSLTEAFLASENVKARTHECVFAYLCHKHPELELSWEFFERLRNLRNRSIYYGEAVVYIQWKEVELQTHIYISTLRKAIEKRVN